MGRLFDFGEGGCAESTSVGSGVSICAELGCLDGGWESKCGGFGCLEREHVGVDGGCNGNEDVVCG